MFRQISILLLIYFAGSSAFAQTEKYTAPVKWERYKVSDKDVSVLFPKLPVLVASGDFCIEQETRQFAAYADNTVYGFTITSKTKEKAPDFCSSKKKFNEKTFADRIVQLKEQLKEFTETKSKLNNVTVSKIAGTDSVYWLINDFSNKRWFELWVVKGDEEKAEVKNFIESIKINKNAEGIEIDSGADRTLGDDKVKINKLQEGETAVLRIALKPQPKYTDAARQTNLQGSVTLKITFSASGGIGNVTPVSGLPYGLTEQSIIAAKKIVFVPAKRNGSNYSVSKTVVYNFSIY